jgi:hypothetical protein
MNWFKRKIYKWMVEVRKEQEEIETKSNKELVVQEEISLGGDPVLNFKVYSAIGGKIVEFRHYDRQKDRNFNQTYIITNDQDFGDRISKIATMEIMKS